MQRGVAAAVVLFAITGCGGSSGDDDAGGSAWSATEPLTLPTKDRRHGKRNEEPARTPTEESGDRPALSRSDYISKADRLCGRNLPKIQALENKAQLAARRGDYETAADLFEQAVAESESEIVALRDLPAPAGDRAILSRTYAGVEKANRLFRRSIDSLRSGDVQGFNSLGDRARLDTRRSKRIVIGFGFKICGQTD